MGNVEATIRSEIVRLAKRETRRMTVPMGRDLRSLKSTVSRLRKTFSLLEKFFTRWERERAHEKGVLTASAEEIKGARFSARLIQALRKRLSITQKELASLIGVTVGAVHQWEKGIFTPRNEKKGALVALRKLGRREVKRLLAEKPGPKTGTKKGVRRKPSRGKSRRKVSRR
jgi:DNA-binding transcriptional regulator YiaG